MIHAGTYLANAYFWASYKGEGKRTFDEEICEEYVCKCEPIIIVQLDASEFDISCMSSKEIITPNFLDSGIRLFFDLVPHKYNENINHIKAWFIAVPDRKDTIPIEGYDFKNYNSIIRNLRINLLRIHVERVVLKKILEKIGRHDEGFQLKKPATEKKVLFHLHKILFNLSKNFRNRQNQERFVQTAFILDELSQEESLELQIEGLKSVIEWLEKSSDRNKPIINISKKIINNMGDQITIGSITGNFINKSHLVNSLNSATANNIDAETKQTLLEIAKKIEDSQNQVAALLFNSFNEELAKSKPEQDKGKLKQFWDGLVKIMPDILTIGKSVAGITALF